MGVAALIINFTNMLLFYASTFENTPLHYRYNFTVNDTERKTQQTASGNGNCYTGGQIRNGEESYGVLYHSSPSSWSLVL